MRGTPGIVAVHDPQPPGREQVPVVLQRLVQQHLLGLALVPGGAGAGRSGGHAEGGAGGGGADPQLAQLRDTGEESSAVPADPNAARLAGVSGTRISDPSIEPISRSPTVTAR